MAAPALVKLRAGGGGRRACRPPGHCGASRAAAPPCAPPRARCPAHARAPARANYRIPGLRAVHRRVVRDRALRAWPAAGSRSSLMFPRPGRPVGSAKPPPCRALAPWLAVGAQPDAQRSPCVRRGGPDGASGFGAPGGVAHSSHFRSPMSPLRTLNARGDRKAAGSAAKGPRSQGQAHPGGREARCGRGARRRPTAAAHSGDGRRGGLVT